MCERQIADLEAAAALRCPKGPEAAPVDCALVDANFLAGSPLAASEMITLHTAEFGQSYVDAFNALTASPVPEPASLLLLGMGTICLLQKRRHR